MATFENFENGGDLHGDGGDLLGDLIPIISGKKGKLSSWLELDCILHQPPRLLLQTF